ncbi:hypothetical protein K1719_047072 [Acacia pycnantha]|nr:hypothetical protein K1719_047072 [Acacia pycnantha]
MVLPPEALLNFYPNTHLEFHLFVCRVGSNNWFSMTFIYGETNYRKRARLCEAIRAMAALTEEAWILLGDFNAYLSPNNKSGSAAPNSISMSDFSECISHAGLFEIYDPLSKFACEAHGDREKLDWVFCNLAWEVAYPHSSVTHDLNYKSDHKVLSFL